MDLLPESMSRKMRSFIRVMFRLKLIFSINLDLWRKKRAMKTMWLKLWEWRMSKKCRNKLTNKKKYQLRYSNLRRNTLTRETTLCSSSNSWLPISLAFTKSAPTMKLRCLFSAKRLTIKWKLSTILSRPKVTLWSLLLTSHNLQKATNTMPW